MRKSTPKPGVVFFHEWYPLLEALPPDAFKLLILAVLHYSETGESPKEIPQQIAPLYAFLRSKVDEDTARYEKIREQNREKGKVSAERRARRTLTTASTYQPQLTDANNSQPVPTDSTNPTHPIPTHSIAPPPQASGRGAYGVAVGGAMLENEKTLDIYPNAPQAPLNAGLQGIGRTGGEDDNINEQCPF